MAESPPEPGPLFFRSRKRNKPSRRDRDWQAVTVAVSLVGMFIFEMFHSPPCRLANIGCGGSDFVAQIAINAIWATLFGTSVGIALAAIMLLVVDALAIRRISRSSGPLIRALVGIAGVVILFVAVLVRFQLVQ